MAGWLASCCLATAQADESLAAQRREFIDAYEAARGGAGPPLAGDSAALVAYPLYPYVQAARLKASIDALPAAGTVSAVNREAEAFLARYGNDPVTRIVRRPWLLSLAERGEWQAFLDAYGQASDPGQALRCRALQGRIALGRTEGLAGPATEEWLTPASADEACDPVFDWMRSRGLLDDTLVERRARLALAQGETRLARWLANSLPEDSARPLREWALLIEDPRAAIDALIRTPAAQVEEEALLAGWTRLARRDPAAAHERYRPLLESRGGGAALASKLAQQVALGLAWSRRQVALDYFARIDAADFDEVTYEWRVRAALWTHDWPRAAEAIAAMPESLRDTARWRYWAARAAEADGDRDRARALYEAVIPADNWFAVLAAARLGRPFLPHHRPVTFDAAQVAVLEDMPAFTRSRELFGIGYVPLAQSEWNAGYGTLDAPGQRAAIALADRWGWYFQAIATAAQQGLFDDYELLYPTPFDAEVAAGARAAGLSGTRVYAVLRQESLYQSWAVSSAGAIGLMQLLPGTARQTASRMRMTRPTRDSLMKPEINVALGAGTLAELIERFDGQTLLALAGYNAGPGAVQRWLPEKAMDADIWVENIPYNETRGYVQRIMWHSVVFQWLSDREPEDASSWLARVRPIDRQ